MNRGSLGNCHRVSGFGVYRVVDRMGGNKPASSYAPVVMQESFAQTMAKMGGGQTRDRTAASRAAERTLRPQRPPGPGVTMSRGKPVQEGVRVKLPEGVQSWQHLAAHDARGHPRKRAPGRRASCPCRTPTMRKAECCFPSTTSTKIKKQEGRDLTRFDLDFDLPDHFLPEFPPPMFLTTRPDLGDVSQGKLVTIDNYFELFNGILNPKQFEGLRLLLTPFPQQQFNATDDRRSVKPSRGVACFDCHVNGHTNGATHLVGDIRPQEFRHRHRHAVAARREHPAAFRLAAGLEVRRGLHRVRAAGRLFRRRPGDRHQEGRQHPRTRQPGPLHGRVPGDVGLPAGPEARPCSARWTRGRPTQSELRGQELFFGKGHAPSAIRPLLHRQLDAQPPADDFSSRKWSTAAWRRRTARSRRSRCAASRTRRRTARRPPARRWRTRSSSST